MKVKHRGVGVLKSTKANFKNNIKHVLIHSDSLFCSNV